MAVIALLRVKTRIPERDTPLPKHESRSPPPPLPGHSLLSNFTMMSDVECC